MCKQTKSSMNDKRFISRVNHIRSKGVSVLKAAKKARVSVMTINRYLMKGATRKELTALKIIKGFEAALIEELEKIENI